MKCPICGKMQDHVDCECGMCTFCGTKSETVPTVKAENK